MNEDTRKHTDTGQDTRPDRGVTDPADVQPTLPLDVPLPFDDEADHPVDLVLTARARRAIAPGDLPALRVVEGDAQQTTPSATSDEHATASVSPASHEPGVAVGRHLRDDPSDTRPSRARALRRAGRSPAHIAAELGVDELLVRAWVADVKARRSRRRNVAPRRDDPARVDAPEARPTSRAAHPSAGASRGARDAEVDDHRTAFELARAAARDEARRVRLADPSFAAGLGLVAGIAELDTHALTLTTLEPEIAGTVLRWLREQLAVDPLRIRVVLRIGPRVAGDLAAQRWARALAVPRERIAVASWRYAPNDEVEQVLLRIADPTVAATVAGWRDALLSPPGDDPADIAF